MSECLIERGTYLLSSPEKEGLIREGGLNRGFTVFSKCSLK